MKTILLFALCGVLCLAGETRTWTESDFQSFQKGNLKNLSIRSDGRLTLAPKTTELYDSSTAYLWTLAQDSKGNIYTAGGPGAKLFRIAPAGKSEKVAEFDALEIHAIAIDSKDRIYVATAPDGKVYRVSAAGKSEEFYDPKQKYIWSMMCDRADNLYVATGDQGEVHRVSPDGKGQVFFKSDETHARSIAMDHDGNLIVGTEPGGLVIRVSPKGDGFVLYQMPKREVTALAIGPKNEVYAAAVGTKSAPPPTPAAPALTPRPTSGNITLGQLPPTSAATTVTSPSTIPGGSDIYRITAQESPEKLWTGAQDIVYGLAFDANGRLLVASGNKGALYRIEDRTLYSTLVSFPVAQITALVPAKDGSIYAATGNVGKVFRVGPGIENEGTIESDVFDSGGFSTWGRITTASDLHGGKVTLTVRAGNLDRPQQNWSPWALPEAVPAARFLQWKATLVAGNGNASPTLDSISAAYLRKNTTPRIDLIEITPANYKFPPPSVPLTISSNASITLPALGAPPVAAKNPDTSTPSFTPAMQYAKGALGVRWSEVDENGDTLIHKIEIRGEKEHNWILLRDKVYEKYYSFDSTAFPDGDYRIRITASDSPSNTPENTLETTEESDPFTIDNSPPKITGLQRTVTGVKWHAADELSTIRKAEYSLDGGDWTVVDPVTKLSDSEALDYNLTLKNLTTGEHTIAVRSEDDNDNMEVAKLVFTKGTA
jgi:sugar lactone lactonase YvrE